MGYVFEFAESEVSAVSMAGDTLVVRFSAASVVDSSGTAGDLRPVELLFLAATWQGRPGACFGRLSEGRLLLEHAALRHVPVPFQSSDALSAELQFRQGEVLLVHARSVALRLSGPAAFFESLAC